MLSQSLIGRQCRTKKRNAYPFNYKDFLFFDRKMFKVICCRIVVWWKGLIHIVRISFASKMKACVVVWWIIVSNCQNCKSRQRYLNIFAKISPSCQRPICCVSELIELLGFNAVSVSISFLAIWKSWDRIYTELYTKRYKMDSCCSKEFFLVLMFRNSRLAGVYVAGLNLYTKERECVSSLVS